MFEARIYVTLKESVLDPQGQAVLGSLHHMGHKNVQDVRIGKYIEVKLNSANEAEARKEIESYCNGLLVNQVIETYRFDLLRSEIPQGAAK